MQTGSFGRWHRCQRTDAVFWELGFVAPWRWASSFCRGASCWGQAEVQAKLYTVEGGGHGGFQDPNVERLVVEFFARHFNPKPR